MEKRLYILIDESLNPVYGCVQGGHAVAQFLLSNPDQEWNNHTLVYLYANVESWKRKLQYYGIKFTEFHEPDLDNKLTSIAIESSNKKLFRNLKLVA